MPNRSGTDFRCHVPPTPDGGTEEALTATLHATRAYRESLGRALRRNARMEAFLESQRAKKADLIGKRAAKRFREFSRSQRASNYGLGSLADVTDAPAQLGAARTRTSQMAADLIAGEGVDPSALRRLRQNLRRTRAVGPISSRPRGQLEFVADSDAPAEIRERRTNPWSIRDVPYDGWDWWYSWWLEDGAVQDPTLTYYSNPATGSVGHRSVWEDYDAGNWDGCNLELWSSVGFWLKPEKTGHLEMWVKTRCIRARYWVWAADEWGWSGYHDQMTSNWTVSLTAGATGDETSSWNMDFYDDDTTWSGDIVPPNTTGWLHLITSGTVTKDNWIYVKFGTHDIHGIAIDDTSMESRMRNHWHLEEAQYRTTS